MKKEKKKIKTTGYDYKYKYIWGQSETSEVTKKTHNSRFAAVLITTKTYRKEFTTK